ncbi:MAG: glycoside hydrolase family 3 C-terminal domain-containing protein [Bacilli bacterium]|nr:glycoside hydrolase family 3 C-terminal domain-containing protein [Bacilli bacterium]
MKKKLLLLGLLPVLGMGAASTKSVNAAGRLDSFYSDVENNRSKYCQKAMDLNAQIADEGVVLLKNEGLLPMSKGSKVTLAGKSSVSLVRGGAGSGAGSVSSGITEIKMDKSLTDAGFQLNTKLRDFYSDNSKSGSGRTNGNTGWKGISEVTIGETPMSKYTQDLKDSMSEFNDAAIFVISREGSEGCDVKTCNASDDQKNPNPVSTRHALQLSVNEEALFNELKTHTDNVIIIINSGNAYECDVFEKDPKVKAVLWMGTPGANGAGAIGRILCGDVNPSGKTVDTWSRDFTKDPSFQNFSDNAQTNPYYGADGKLAGYAPADTMFNADGTPVRSDGTFKGAPTWEDEAHKVVNYGLNGVRPSAYLNYEEGIYVDYRYFETVYADLEKSSGKAAADAWYDGQNGVVYPFGYGLSYTSFTQEIVASNVKNKSLTNKDGKVTVKVKVTNTGNVAGKDAVQVYFKAPYTSGGIEKPYNALCAIGKTGLIQPGKSEVVDCEFYLQDVASYDFSDANKNGFKGYELDAGSYSVSINKSAHEEYDAVSFAISGGFKYETDRYTGYSVENRFTDNGFYSSLPSEDDFEFTQMSRADFEGTFPTHPTIEDRTLGAQSRVEEFFTHKFTMDDVEKSDTWEYVPEDVYKTKEDIEALGWRQQATKLPAASRTVKLTDMIGSSLDDPRWETILNEMTWEEMEQFVDGASHNPAISEIGKLDTNDSDGPSKFQIMWWCGGPIVAATFNVELAKLQGDCVGEEAHLSNNTYGWAGPGVNIHRSPFGGRNFEYYSGDPFLTGRIAGRVIAGATDKGVYCFFKHFAVNDQEKHREGVACFLTEQALREIYLKPFQMCVQEGKSTGIMSSYNRLGLMETAASYPLLTEVLRNEWGFKGSIISDMTHHGNSAFNAGMYENINNRILAGCNNQLDGDDYSNDMNCKWTQSANGGLGAPVYKSSDGSSVESYSWWYAVRTMCKECLWMNAQSGIYSKSCDVLDTRITFSGTVNGRYVANVGDDIDIEVTLPDFDSDYTKVEIDPYTPLPQGLEFDGSSIYGSLDEAFNGFIHVNVVFEDKVVGNSFELVVPSASAVDEFGEEVVLEEPTKKGCGGSIAAASGLIATIAVAGAALLASKRKED